MRRAYFRRQRRKLLTKFLFLIFLLLCLIGGIRQFFFGPRVISMLQDNQQIVVDRPTPVPTVISSSLGEAVERALVGTTGTYGVVIKHLNTGERYVSSGARMFEPASLYKLWVMAAVYREIEQGQMTLDDTLQSSIPLLNQRFGISPEYAELTSGSIRLTVKDAIEQMITISHNYAALLLSDSVKVSVMQAFLREKGLGFSTFGNPPQTTPADIALFLEKLYKGELGTPENTTAMLEVLKRQTLNHKVPKYLPQGTPIAHKTGELNWFTHDAGIIYTPKGEYVIVVMSESESPKGAEERIAQLSREVYTYFMK